MLKIDTGADCNVMALKVFNSLRVKVPFEKTRYKLKVYDGHQLSVLGKVDLECEYKHKILKSSDLQNRRLGPTIHSGCHADR